MVLMARRLLVGLVLAGLPLSPTFVSTAHAATACTTTLSNTVITGGLVVPAGENCTLDNVVVNGGVRVEPGGVLFATGVFPSSRINGGLTATSPQSVYVTAARITGEVTITQVGGFLNFSGNTVGGSVTIVGATNSGVKSVNGNTVRGNLVLQEIADLNVFDNQVSGALRCSGNTPDPIGGNNTANGGKFGQCAAL